MLNKKIILLLGVMAIIIIRVLFMTEVGGYGEGIKIKKRLEEEIKILERNIGDIEKQLEQLDSDEFIERKAREQLKYSKPNEYVFRMREK